MRKLYKDTQNKIICGVCSGVADYLNLDVSLVRVLWAVLTICTFSFGFWLYLIYAIIVPDKNDVN